MYDLQQRYNRQIAGWLIICALVILAMILLGGVTRLTGSGLSMVEWRPLMGIIPPLNEQQWLEVFAKYQLYPEYQKVNSHMDVHDFKYIFMYEYLHRVLGRSIGLLFLLPFLFFYFTKRIKPGLTPKLLIMFVLGGLQGLLGWYMVKSGLVDNPRVSQYRLAAHFGAAVIIYGYILWVALDLLRDKVESFMDKGLRNFAFILSGLIFFMMLSGAFVAGTRAGFAYPTFPLMGNSFIPTGLYAMTPAWLSAFEDVTTIQFNHRIFAYFLTVLILFFVVKVFRSKAPYHFRIGAVCLLVLLIIQVSLGISTLLMHVPVVLASAHQGVGVLLLSASLYLSHCYAKRSE